MVPKGLTDLKSSIFYCYYSKVERKYQFPARWYLPKNFEETYTAPGSQF